MATDAKWCFLCIVLNTYVLACLIKIRQNMDYMKIFFFLFKNSFRTKELVFKQIELMPCQSSKNANALLIKYVGSFAK